MNKSNASVIIATGISGSVETCSCSWYTPVPGCRGAAVPIWRHSSARPAASYTQGP